MSCTYELCEPKSTDCSIYKGVGCESKGISDGDTLTSVLDKLMDCDNNTLIPTTPTTNTFEPIQCAGTPSCLVGVTYAPIDWTMSDSLGFSYDLTNFVTSLGTGFTLLQTKVQVYSTQNIFTSNDLAAGFTATIGQLPAFVDIDVMFQSSCGLIKFTTNFVLTCSGSGTYQATMTPKGGGELIIASQSDFNSFIKNEVQTNKNTLKTALSSLKLPSSELYPTNYMSQKSAILVLADTSIKLDTRLKALEDIKGCSNSCANCPGSSTQTLQEIITEMCELIDSQSQTITTLTARVTQLEAFH